ncbi:MAG: alpha-amylase family glycosyl hydrolase [Candidatus Sulfotelmatobacter sp.]
MIQEVNPRTFSATGDFRGMEQRLDYLKDPGVTVVWIMPIHPVGQAKKKGSIESAYAVQHYYAINPFYGTKDFKRLVSEAHQRGLKVIIDIVANHTAWDSVLMKRPEFYKSVRKMLTVTSFRRILSGLMWPDSTTSIPSCAVT